MTAPRLVLDTDVIVAGLVSASGASRRLLLAALDGTMLLLLSTPLLLEYEAVLTRPEHLARSGVSARDVGALLDEIAARCEPVALHYRWRPQARDPNDDLVLDTAINGVAVGIATFNIRDMVAGAARFGIPVERPGHLVRRFGL